MAFDLNEEQTMFRDAVRTFGQKELKAGALQRAHDTGYPWDVARRMAGNGLLGITVAEADGGIGGSLMDAVIAIEEIGRGLPAQRRCRAGRQLRRDPRARANTARPNRKSGCSSRCCPATP